MKKKLIFTMILAGVVSLSACGGNADSGSVNQSLDSSIPEASDSATIPDDEKEEELVYGTATLTYAQFFAGDVSSTESYDAVSSATTSKYAIMPNMATDFVDEETNADGYRITGVQNVNIAVAASEYEAYLAMNPTFVLSEGDAPAQYKKVTIENGEAVYSETQFNIADTVTDAAAVLKTGTTWGDYQIDVTDGAVVHLRNTREDEFDINSEIQGIILETGSGLKVGMEYLQSIWVQPYEVSFNVLEDNSHNTHIAAFDNLPELSRLVGETVVKIIYIMPNDTYVYEFDGIYIKPIYIGEITSSAAEDYHEITLSASDFSAFENGLLTVTYTLGSGRQRTVYTLQEAKLENGTVTYSLDLSEIADAEKGGIYAAVISSDSYADLTVSIPVSEDQRQALEKLVATAKVKLAEEPENVMLAAHIEEAEELLGNEGVSSAAAGELIAELTQLTATEEGNGGEGHGSGENGGGGRGGH